MIIAFVGTVNDESDTPISGNGKTCGMTGYAYLDYLNKKHIWSNYQTDFSEKICGMQEMITEIGSEAHPDTIMCISEMQQVLNSIGSTYDQILFIDMFASQLRKLDVDLYYDTQRFNNIHKRLRIHTDVILIPHKFHFDNTRCNFNRCMKPHKIYMYSHKPFKPKYLKIFSAPAVGKHYETKEIVMDKLIIPSKKKVKEML
jgi:hypothetical protein